MPVHDWTRVYAGLFHNFYQSWSVGIANQLNAGMLPEGMVALIERKPSLSICGRSKKEYYSDRANLIVIKQSLTRTIAAIEIVSPGNNISKRAFRLFRNRCLEFINAGIHLLVIDLFPPTKRDPFGVHRVIWDEFEEEDVLFEFPPDKDRILASYHAGREKAAYVDPIAVGDIMRDMPLFLFDGRHIKVPLEAAYQTTWSFLPRDMQVIVETGVMPGSGGEE